jgi:hypothetical protein
MHTGPRAAREFIDNDSPDGHRAGDAHALALNPPPLCLEARIMTLQTHWFIGQRPKNMGHRPGTEPCWCRYWYNDHGIIAVEWA